MSTNLSKEDAVKAVKKALDIPQVTAKGHRSMKTIIADVGTELKAKNEEVSHALQTKEKLSNKYVDDLGQAKREEERIHEGRLQAEDKYGEALTASDETFKDAAAAAKAEFEKKMAKAKADKEKTDAEAKRTLDAAIAQFDKDKDALTVAKLEIDNFKVIKLSEATVDWKKAVLVAEKAEENYKLLLFITDPDKPKFLLRVEEAAVVLQEAQGQFSRTDVDNWIFILKGQNRGSKTIQAVVSFFFEMGILESDSFMAHQVDGFTANELKRLWASPNDLFRRGVDQAFLVDRYCDLLKLPKESRSPRMTPSQLAHAGEKRSRAFFGSDSDEDKHDDTTICTTASAMKKQRLSLGMQDEELSTEDLECLAQEAQDQLARRKAAENNEVSA